MNGEGREGLHPAHQEHAHAHAAHGREAHAREPHAADSGAARAELWEALAIMEDALSVGFHRKRPTPDFSRLAAARRAAQAGAPDAASAVRQTVVQQPAVRQPAVRQPAPSALKTAALAPAAFTPLAAADSAAGLEDLRERALECVACGLSRTRNTVVFGMGVPRPGLLVVGEGPGAEEDRRGLPFVGPSGQLLDRMLASIGLSRETDCYIANIVKCRPPGNREPAPSEKEACIGYLHAQIRLLKPRAILCAGRTAAQGLLRTDEGINRLRGREFAFEGIPVVATYHPSALLRDETLKRPAWEDMKRLRGLLSRDLPARDSGDGA